jgi:hypothetical protein
VLGEGFAFHIEALSVHCMAIALSSSSSVGSNSSPLGDALFAIYSQAGAGGGFPTSFDTSGVDAIVAAYSTSSGAVNQTPLSPVEEDSSLNVAIDAVLMVQDLSYRLEELAYASSNPWLPDRQRRSLQNEYEATVSKIERVAADTRYDGEELFDGTPFRVRVGRGIDASIQSGGIDLQSLTLGLANLDISTLGGAFDAMDTVRQFSDQVDRQASRSLDSAEMRLVTIRQGLESLTGGASSSLIQGATSGGLSGYGPFFRSQMLQSYQSSLVSLIGQAGASANISLFA